jgi:phytoene desaturase
LPTFSEQKTIIILKKIIVIGSGFSGLAAAASLAKEGFDVTVVEKNSSPGGRARMFESNGFIFDMGPSWYWMPDIFEEFFAKFGHQSSDFYTLKRLDPSYRVFFDNEDVMDLPALEEDLFKLFDENEEEGSRKLRKFLKEAKYKYEAGLKEYVWKPGNSLLEYFDLKILKSVFRIKMFTSISKEIRALFKNPKLIKLLEFPVLFLGATPQNTPALYSLMNYADMKLGTWYPMGGMYEIIKAMQAICIEQGVKFEFNQDITKFAVEESSIVNVQSKSKAFDSEIVVVSADYHHMEQHVLDEEYRMYDKNYWDNRTMAPSSLLFYLGFDKKIDSLLHHNLFFDKDFEQHAEEIYENPKWPEQPLFYLAVPSKSDSSVAPEGYENVFMLMPLAPDLEDSESLREKYFDIQMKRLEELTGEDIRSHVIYKRSYCIKDFKDDYYAYKGNAYGLANTLRQTALLKPKMKSKKLKNLYFTGQLTVPGPGVPPALISGQLVAKEIVKKFVN